MQGTLQKKDLERYIGDFVYGANDGIITTFAVVAGIAGAKLSAAIVIILGLASLIADGISMAASNYLATKSESDYLKRETDNHNHHFKDPIKGAIITFVGFILVGFAPLIAYVFPFEAKFQWAIAFAGVSLFAVGAGRTVVTKKGWLKNGIEMLAIGAVAAGAAYAIGALLRDLVAAA